MPRAAAKSNPNAYTCSVLDIAYRARRTIPSCGEARRYFPCPPCSAPEESKRMRSEERGAEGGGRREDEREGRRREKEREEGGGEGGGRREEARGRREESTSLDRDSNLVPEYLFSVPDSAQAQKISSSKKSSYQYRIGSA
eukprot:3141113-Rhodomonas_salina.1